MAQDFISGVAILNRDAARRTLRRMAFEIAEANADEPGLVIAGIEGNGALLAQNLVAELQQIIQTPIRFITIGIDKREPLQVTISENRNWNGAVIIVVDDVSNTGKTLLYALKPFLLFQPKKIQTLVLVERSHKLFSIQPDYVGLSLSTTLQEHISVVVKDGAIEGAWLH